MLKFLTVTLAALLSQTTTALTATGSGNIFEEGFKTSIDISVIEQAKDTYFQAILEAINGIKIPDFDDGHGNYLKDNTFHIKECTSKVVFKTDTKHNALILDNQSVTAQFKSHKYRYKVAPLIVAKGHMEVDFNKIEIQVGDSFSTQKLEDGTLLPKVTGVDVKVKINRSHIKIHLHGNFISDVADLFTWFIKGTVANQIEGQCTDILKNTVPASTNAFLAKTHGTVAVPGFDKKWMLDWQTPNPAQIHTDWLGIGFKALFFDQDIGREEPAQPAVSMPLKDKEHPEKFQNWISAYSVNGFLHSLTEVADVKFWIRNQAITCAKLNTLLPGLAKHYGGEQPVDVFIQIHQIENFEVFDSTQEMRSESYLDLQFWVHTAAGETEYAAGLGLEDVKFGFQALTKDMTLTLQLTQLNVGKVNILECAYGHLSAASVKLEINNGFRVAKPFLNTLLQQKPIQFPEEVFGLFKLEALTLQYYDNYVYAGITPIFIGPSSTPSHYDNKASSQWFLDKMDFSALGLGEVIDVPIIADFVEDYVPIIDQQDDDVITVPVIDQY